MCCSAGDLGGATEEPLRLLENSWNEILAKALAAVSRDDSDTVDGLAVEIRDVEVAIAQAPATDIHGLAVKLRLLKHALAVGTIGQDQALCDSAIDDVESMIRTRTQD